MMKIGFIGLGLMGIPMAKRILNANLPLYIWNRTKEKTQPLINLGAIATASPKELAKQVDIILLCVTDEHVIETILFGEDGVLAASNSQQIIVDHSTISPLAVKTIASRTEKAGMIFIDAPVTGSISGATNGTLIVFAGGNSEAIEKVKPVLATYSKRINYMGASGSGQITKACNQIMLLNTIFSTFETLNLAKQQGLEPDKLLSALEGSLIDSKAWQIFSQAAISNNPQKLAPIKNVMKDLEYIQTLAKLTNSPVFLTKTSAELTNILIEKGMGHEDIIELMQVYTR